MQKEIILVVEDDEQYRKLICEILRAEGYTILDACNGEEALQLCKSKKLQVDLLFTDVIMPRMDGVTLSERLVILLPKMKVIFSSGYTEKSKLLRNVENEEINFIEKPYDPSTLLKKVANVLRAPFPQLPS